MTFSWCDLQLGCLNSNTISTPVDGRLILAHSPSLLFTNAFISIIDPLHANWNDNQWRHLYALSNPANEGNY